MEFATMAAARFGYGPSPHMALPARPPADYMAAAGGRRCDGAALPDFARGRGGGAIACAICAFERAESEQQDRAAAAFKALRQAMNEVIVTGLRARIARAVEDPTGFRERLQQFWTDHFTVVGRRLPEHPMTLEHQEFAVRPHMTGRFADLLKAAVTHSAMIMYLDQDRSVGPNSKQAQKRPQKRMGLNENLAREVMELHTLGVAGSYTQTDVRQLAELFTGMMHSDTTGFKFQPGTAEPGAEEVLGTLYGGGRASMEDIYAVLDDLAAIPIRQPILRGS